MTAFSYRAIDPAGKEVTGTLEGDSARGVRNTLRQRGLLPVAVDRDRPLAGRHRGGTIAAADLALLTRQWASLLQAALTVEQSLAALVDQTDQESVAAVLAGVRGEVMAGFSLKAGLDRHAGSFPDIYRASIAAGEQTGQLPRIMLQLADYLERRDHLRRKVMQALIYPLLVTLVALLVVTGLMVYVVPQVLLVFQQSKQSLPFLTLALIAGSGFLRSYGWLLVLVVAGAGFGLAAALRHPDLRRRWHRCLLRLPIVGRHWRALETTRFASTLAILAGSGVPLLAALAAGRQVLAAVPLQEAVAAATEQVKAGLPLSRALGRGGAFPPLLVHLLASGERTGDLAAMLERAAALQQSELENRTAVLTALLEPLLLLAMGGFVLLIVMAVMQPIIDMNQMFQ